MNSKDNIALQDSIQAPASTPGVSGRKLTIAILASLALLCGSLAYFLQVYDRLDVQRANTKVVWRTLANLLDTNYKKIDNLPTVELGVDEAWKQQFAEMALQFRTSTNIETQTTAANKIESRLSELAKSSAGLELLTLDPALKEQIELYNQSIEAETAIMESWAGSVVHKVLPAPVRAKLSVDR